MTTPKQTCTRKAFGETSKACARSSPKGTFRDCVAEAYPAQAATCRTGKKFEDTDFAFGHNVAPAFDPAAFVSEFEGTSSFDQNRAMSKLSAKNRKALDAYLDKQSSKKKPRTESRYVPGSIPMRETLSRLGIDTTGPAIGKGAKKEKAKALRESHRKFLGPTEPDRSEIVRSLIARCPRATPEIVQDFVAVEPQLSYHSKKLLNKEDVERGAVVREMIKFGCDGAEYKFNTDSKLGKEFIDIFGLKK